LIGALVSASAGASDWPQFLGPARNGACDGPELAVEWPGNGPPIAWRKPVGHGFSGPVESGGRVILFHRVADQEVVDCLDAHTGNLVWHFAYATTYEDEFGFDNGPRATPTIAGNRVYTFGAQGVLCCLAMETGKKLWSVDVQKEFHAPNGFFGLACSPLVEGSSVLLNIGGQEGAGIVAFDAGTGKLLWKGSQDEASYSSPVAATIDGHRYALFFTREGLVAVDPIKGDLAFQYSWHSRNRMSVNAATPLVFGDTIFLSASYGTGATLLRWHQSHLEKLWSGDDLLSTHYATCVEYNGFLFGIHGRADPGYSPRPKLRCVELKEQKVRWEADNIGAATLTRSGNQLIILTEKGELIQASASPESFQPKCRAQVLPSQVRAFPALADGYFYARSQDELVCIDLRRSR
ncbi:MAG TPA: PQQ-binding-like beta-propeller repeat protein, partial [Verrucomicrobiae bacterium]|nr:PQQ-binding-like beta-propeller repeat protein [Verrucomicrobiae bacterium]